MAIPQERRRVQSEVGIVSIWLLSEKDMSRNAANNDMKPDQTEGHMPLFALQLASGIQGNVSAFTLLVHCKQYTIYILYTLHICISTCLHIYAMAIGTKGR